MIIFTLLAQNRIGCGGGLGPFASFLCKGTVTTQSVGTKLNTALSGIIGFLTIIAALWFAIQIILAGIQWINAGGDKNTTQAAWQKITNAVIGLVIVVAAWVIIAIIGTLLGLSILNPGSLLNTIQIK